MTASLVNLWVMTPAGTHINKFDSQNVLPNERPTSEEADVVPQ